MKQEARQETKQDAQKEAQVPRAPRELAQVQHTKELVRVLNTDLRGDSNVYTELTKIKGISWSMSNVVCHLLNLEKGRKINTLDDSEIKMIEETIKGLHTKNLPTFILNKPRAHEGQPKHLIGTDLDLQLRTDIKGMRDIQSYKGIRHALGLPVRGQRTKSHFRHGKAVGVTKKKAPPAKAAPRAGGK